MKILVFPCGTEIGLEIHQAFQGTNIHLIGGSSVDDHGKFTYKNYIGNLPFVNNDNFIKEISKIDFDFIYPAHDQVIYKISQSNLPYIGSPPETCSQLYSKLNTYNLFCNHIKTPKINPDEFPVFIKPNIGNASRGCHIANNAQEMAFYEGIRLEYLPGEEYTVDCFTDFNGELKFSAARVRRRMSGGLATNTITIEDKEFSFIAQKINSVLFFNGAWHFQLKRDKNGELTLLEIATRIGGSSCICRMRGVNLPFLSYLNQIKTPVDITFSNYEVEMDRAWNSKYKLDIKYDKVYIGNAEFTPELIRFVAECKENGKYVCLFGKSKYEILFDEIINVVDRKSKYIKNNSILIDGNMSDRIEVHKILGIPVFSPDAIRDLW